MEKVIRVLQFLRVVDENRNISLTNLAVVTTLAHLLWRQDLSLEAVGAFLATVVGYQVKRFAKPVSPSQDAQDLQDALRRLEQVETKVTGLQLGKQIKR